MANILNLSTTKHIQKLRSLNNGWLDGYGKAPSSIIIDLVVQLLEPLWDLHEPDITPSLEGGVDINWPDLGIAAIIDESHNVQVFSLKNIKLPPTPDNVTSESFRLPTQLTECINHLKHCINQQ